ncbi:hypothetical protein BH20BAC1_BH20BAC1_00820 [soil metagenome]
MKKVLLSIGFSFFMAAVFSQTSCPTQFFRNNGNNKGCASHIKLYFSDCPVYAPRLDSIKINGVIQPETFTLLETVCRGKSYYAEYCISDDNLAPAHRLTIYLTYLDGKTGAIAGKSVCDVAAASVAPVELTAFEAQGFGNSVKLTWTTEDEVGFSRFDIEKSSGNNEFERLGTVLSGGQGTMKQYYSFTDNYNSGDVSFYRLKMIDKDGKFTYSDTRAIKSSTATIDFSVYPNPSHGSAKISVSNSNEGADIQVLDMSGRMINKFEISNSSSASLSNLNKGTYIIRITGKQSGVTMVKKLNVVE